MVVIKRVSVKGGLTAVFPLVSVLTGFDCQS